MKSPLSIIGLIAFCLLFCFVVYPIERDPVFKGWMEMETEIDTEANFPPPVPASPVSSASTGRPFRGGQLFRMNCAACHNQRMEMDLSGPALYGVMNRVPSREWVYGFIRNSQEVIASGDPYAIQLYEEWNKTQMTAMPHLTDQDIEDLILYIEAYSEVYH